MLVVVARWSAFGHARGMRRKVLPDHEQEAIAAEVNSLLAQKDASGARVWTATSLGQACGGLTHEAIRLARNPAGVGPAVREGLLLLLGTTMEQLLAKHGIAARPTHLETMVVPLAVRGASVAARRGSAPGTAVPPNRPGSRAAASNSGATSTASTAPTSVSGAQDRIGLARNVIAALEEDGVSRETAQHYVGKVVFEESWTDQLDLYRRACARMRAESLSAPGPLAGPSEPHSKRRGR